MLHSMFCSNVQRMCFLTASIYPLVISYVTFKIGGQGSSLGMDGWTLAVSEEMAGRRGWQKEAVDDYEGL